MPAPTDGRSAGRFHHARTQLQRFLGGIGGFTGARDTYSNAAGAVLVKNVLGSLQAMNGPGTSWKSIAEHADLVVMFGGVPTRNTQVTPGGVGEHTSRGWLQQVKAAGVEFCNISPMRDDAAAFLDAEWIAPRPHSDTAIMLGLAHTLVVEGLHDADFLARYCAGFDRFRDYLLGRRRRRREDAEWAARLERDFCRHDSRPRAQDGARRAPSSTSTGRCSAAITASSRSGRRSRWRPCSAKSDCRAAASASATEAWKASRACVQDSPTPDAFARSQSGSQLHSGGAESPTCCSTRAAVSVQRPRLRLSRYRARLLVRRQSVSSSSGSQPVDSRVAAARHDHRARSVVDCDCAPCGYRAAGDHDARARRYRRERARQIHHRDEAGDRAGRRSARRLRNLQRPRGALRNCANCSPKDATRSNGCVISMRPRASARIATARMARLR